MTKFERVVLMEVEVAEDKSSMTPGGKYRKDSIWLIEAFRKKGVEAEILFITGEDTAESLKATYANTAFLGRVNPMDYATITFERYAGILTRLKADGLLLDPDLRYTNLIGTKAILFDLRDSTLGISGIRYHTLKDMKDNADTEINRILPPNASPRVLKRLRGSTGLGIWKLENVEIDGLVVVTDGFSLSTEELPRAEILPKFVSQFQEDAISMPYLPFIKDGEFRFMMCKQKVVQVVNKRPANEAMFTATIRAGAIYTSYEPEEPIVQPMVAAIERWLDELKEMKRTSDLPHWWSIDCIEIESNPADRQRVPSINPGRRLVLSEINCSNLGMEADRSSDMIQKGMRFAEMVVGNMLA